MMRSFRTIPTTFAAVALTLCACSEPAADVVAEPGEPIPGLSAEAAARFAAGKALFEHGWTPEEGLGPSYVQDRCTSCHDIPSSGGSSPEDLPKFARGCDALGPHGGSILQLQRTPLLVASGVEREGYPPEATVRSTLVPLPLYGLGLVEAVPEADILSREDPDDADGDGISGRAGWTADGRLARLDRKASTASIIELVHAALITEIGITTPSYPVEETINGLPVPPESDPVADPEVGDETAESIADFVRFLAPIVSEQPATAAVRDSLEQGGQLFESVGCAECHVPTLTTGPNEEPGLDRRTFPIYSDLLLHDMGPDMTGMCGHTATATELRTQRLIGLRYRDLLMFDGRASGLRQSILFHGGESAASRDAFLDLPTESQALVYRFLLSL